MIQIDMEMPKCCDECFALDDQSYYPFCLISQDQRGYTFNTRKNRMPTCPLKEQEKATIEPKRIDLADETKAWLDKMNAAEALGNIADICIDWDGYRTANGLGGLINEIWTYARYCADRLLKAQKPRVMTMEELIGIYHFRDNHSWVYNTPPYLWMENCYSNYGHWISWTNIVSCLERRYPKYIPEDYSKTWRCWTAMPTDEQKEAVPWN